MATPVPRAPKPLLHQKPPNRPEHYPAIKYIEILDELAATMAASLIESGIAPAPAQAAADKAAARVQEEYGGGPPIYFPKGLGYQLARRNAEIRRRLASGESRETIRRAYSLTDERLRQIESDATPSRGFKP